MAKPSVILRSSVLNGGAISSESFGKFLEANHKPLWLAITHHRTHNNKPMTLKGHYYLKEILLDTSRKRVLKKSTQGGISECLIIMCWNAANDGKVVFYVLPTDQLKNRFVSNRFEKSLFFTDYYRQQKVYSRSESFLKRDTIDNKSLKDIGRGVINFAGSGSDVPFIEIPADWFVVDEADKCDANRLQMGLERLGHSSDPHEIYVGNPTFIGSFLDQKFNLSTKSRWFINADCGHKVQIDFFKHVVRQVAENTYVIRDKDFEIGEGKDVRPICDVCEKPFNRFGYGEYVSEQQSDISGKHVSRLFSGSSSLLTIVDNFSKALENDYKLQRFYNSDLGESFTAEGARITEQSLDECVDNNYHFPEECEYPTIAGIDVGTLCHIVIGAPMDDKIKLVKIVEVPISEPYEIIEIFKRFRVKVYVIDALPETRFARKLSSLYRVGFLCYYSQFKKELIVNVKDCILSADRTVSLDTLKEQVVLQKMVLPANARSIKNLYEHMTSSVRVYNEDNDRYEWVQSGPDHYFHAFNYMVLAKKIITMAT